MPVNSENDLPPNQRATFLKAMSAMELKNYGYAVQLLQSILRIHPEFLIARQMTRKAAVGKTGGKKSLLGGGFSGMKVQGQIKKDPVGAMDAIEKMLESDPYSAQINQLLKEAALGAKMPEIALFALETIVEGNPKDAKTMHELAKLYLENQMPEKAVDVYGRILRIAPNDLDAVKGAKDAAAAASMQRGGWEKQETTYRDLIRDKNQAVSLEQQGRVYRSEEMIENLLSELHPQIEADPSNVDLARRIAELYEQKEDLASAVTWYGYAAELTKNTDSALVRKVSDLQMKQYDASIAQWEEYIAANQGSPELPDYIAQLETIKKQRAEILLDEARKRVDRNPTDLQLRFELGEVLLAAGHYKEAVPELQKAQNNPNVRLRAMNLLGQCYTARGMFDLAANILSKAAADLYQMDNTKKDIVYNLGLVYQKMSQQEKYIDCMKQIYEVDYSYRDVAERVESSYGQGQDEA